jgi:hypothetical protein
LWYNRARQLKEIPAQAGRADKKAGDRKREEKWLSISCGITLVTKRGL